MVHKKSQKNITHTRRGHRTSLLRTQFKFSQPWKYFRRGKLPTGNGSALQNTDVHRTNRQRCWRPPAARRVGAEWLLAAWSAHRRLTRDVGDTGEQRTAGHRPIKVQQYTVRLPVLPQRCSLLTSHHHLSSNQIKPNIGYLLARPTITKSTHEITDTWGANWPGDRRETCSLYNSSLANLK